MVRLQDTSDSSVKVVVLEIVGNFLVVADNHRKVTVYQIEAF